MNLIVPDWSDAPKNVGAFCTTRSGGVSLAPYDNGTGVGGLNLATHVGDQSENVRLNRALLKAQLPSEPIWLNQVHGSVVVNAAEVFGGQDADAAFTNQPDVVCVVQTADCLPVLLCDLSGNVVAAAHAGWRSLAGGVLENTVQQMRGVGAGAITAWLGPAIGPQHFEVGSDVMQAFTQRHSETAAAFDPISGKDGKYLADIYLLARMILSNLDIGRVYGGGLCTVSDPNRFYSYRRDGVTGRMASLIWSKKS